MSQLFHHQNHKRAITNSLSDNASVMFCGSCRKLQRKDTECQEFVKRVIMSHLFKIIMISTVSLNAFFMVLWTDYKTRYKLFRLFEVSELIFVSIYSSEFCMKLYVDPIDYWKDGYNVLDVVIIITVFIPYGLRKFKGKHYPYLNIADGIQSLRILKLITYSRGIRTLITAVGQTVYTVASVIILLFVLMYIFAILGFYLFGVPDGGDMNNWGNLAVAFFTLFSLATDSIKKFERELMVERHMTLMEEKQVILKRQQEEVSRLMQRRKNVDYKSFSELVENFKKTLRHTDPMVLDDFGTSLPFIDVYLTTLDNQDTTICKLQELYYEIVHVLNLMLEDLPQKKQSHSSENVDEK
ncbi:cation channel sperm-associated protein 3 isoform X2 [Equus przewalskii]|uniref:Cation channel sperm-associated protein 3 isoform X2 n=1 Tax=Equus przewalskii TaxID=9798 RepID=A0ABM4KFT7_EQUPR